MLSTSAIYGTHQEAIYNAEALKSQFRRSAVGLLVGTHLLGTHVTTLPQFDPTVQPVYRSSPIELSLGLPLLGNYVTTLPQADPTIQPVHQKGAGLRNAPFAGSEYLWGTHLPAIYNAEALKSQIRPSVVGSILPMGPLGSYTTTNPFPDTTLQSNWYASAKASFIPTGLLGKYSYTPPQVFDVQPAHYSAPLTNGGWIQVYVSAGPDATEYYQPESYQTPSSPGPVVLTGILAKYYSVLPQIDDRPTFRTTPAQPAPVTIPGSGIPYLVTQPQIYDPTLPAVYQKVSRTPLFFGSTVYPRAVVQPQLYDATLPNRHSAPFSNPPTPPGPTIAYRFPVPPQVDLAVNGTQIRTPSTFSPSTPLPPVGGISQRPGGRVIIPAKKLGETIFVLIDFISQLGQGETITGAICSCTVYTGTDPSPASVLSGAAGVSGTIVSQLTTGGTLGTIYELLAKATTSFGQTIELAGYLAVVPDLP